MYDEKNYQVFDDIQDERIDKAFNKIGDAVSQLDKVIADDSVDTSVHNVAVMSAGILREVGAALVPFTM